LSLIDAVNRAADSARSPGWGIHHCGLDDTAPKKLADVASGSDEQKYWVLAACGDEGMNRSNQDFNRQMSLLS